MTEHTPTLWVIWGPNDSGAPVIAEAKHLLHVATVDSCGHLDDDANAAHIVRCVNAHEGLLAALRRLLAAHEGDAVEYDAARHAAIEVIAEASVTAEDAEFVSRKTDDAALAKADAALSEFCRRQGWSYSRRCIHLAQVDFSTQAEATG